MFPDLLLCIRLLIGLALVLAGFGLACVLVWAFLAATIKTWNVLLGRDRFSWKDTVTWFRKLPRWTKDGVNEQHAWLINNGYYRYDYLFGNGAYYPTDEESLEAKNFLRSRGYDV